MYFIRKLKPPSLSKELSIALFFLLPVIIITAVLWGLRAMWGAIALVEIISAVFQLILFFRTKNNAFLWMTAALLLIVIFAIQVSLFGMTKYDPAFAPLSLGVIFAGIIIGAMLISKKVKWRTREILELAAMEVSETKNGFTERPLHVSRIEGTNSEMEAFGLFLYKHLIAIPYPKDGKIYFSLTSSFWRQVGLKAVNADESWVSFDQGGHVSVFISKKDYLLYRDIFSFDQLCTNLGQLFIEFFESFKHGDGIRIIDRLNALKLNPLTE